MKKVFKYLVPYVPRMIFGLIIKFTGTIMDLFLPWILAYIIDNVIPDKNLKAVFIWGVLMVLCSICAVVFNIIANRMASSVARDTTRTIRHDLFTKISHLSSSQVDKFTVPSLISRMTSDTYNVHQFIGMMQRIGIRAPILLIGGICVTLTLDKVLALILILTMPLIAIAVTYITKKSVVLFREQQKSSDKMITKVRENITGIRVIKALSKSDYESYEFDEVNKEVVKKEKKASMVTALVKPYVSLLLNIGLVVVVIVGGIRVNKGLTEVGKIIAFLTYFTIMLNAMMAITRIFVVFSKASASANRIDEVLQEGEDLIVHAIPIVKSNYHIEFNHVSFSYNGVEDNLTDVNFKLLKGESLGIIGSTGAGKTTIINLLMRMYDVNKGEILINGRNIKSIDKSELSRMFGVTFQNDSIFADSIKGNICLGRVIDINQVQKAAEYAQATEFINNKENGFDSEIDIRGANLSGGQKQRLLVARALVGNPEILILDDSSSALDYKTDATIRKFIYDFYKDTTKIVIAQRISSVMSLDKIFVIEDGNIVAMGKHDELIRTCDIYKEISNSQIGGE